MSRIAFGGSVVFVVAGLVACGGASQPAATPVVSIAPGRGRCPDLAKADEVSTFDFASEFALSHEAADKLKAATLAAAEIMQLSDKLDAGFGIACAQIALGLGTTGDFRSGHDACSAAYRSVLDARQKIGAKTTPKLVVHRPICLTDASAMTKCASLCDSSVTADRASGYCAFRAGRCDGSCTGVCDVKSRAKCEGNCSGMCDGAMKGACGGRCKGTCDGRASYGYCVGTCVGTCEGSAMTGECKGQCSGACELKAPAICDGLCAGTCSVALDDAKCAGNFKTPHISAPCLARCELAIMGQTECSIPKVGLVFSGRMSPKERDQADAMKVAIDKSFPGLLKILYELGDDGTTKVKSAQAVILNARAAFKTMARSDVSESQLTKCFSEPFKTAAAQASVITSVLDRATAVRNTLSK